MSDKLILNEGDSVHLTPEPCPLTFDEVISLVKAERKHQIARWGEDKKHAVGSWLTILRQKLDDATERWVRGQGDLDALTEINQIAAVAVACLEEHGLTLVKDFADGGSVALRHQSKTGTRRGLYKAASEAVLKKFKNGIPAVVRRAGAPDRLDDVRIDYGTGVFVSHGVTTGHKYVLLEDPAAEMPICYDDLFPFDHHQRAAEPVAKKLKFKFTPAGFDQHGNLKTLAELNVAADDIVTGWMEPKRVNLGDFKMREEQTGRVVRGPEVLETKSEKPAAPEASQKVDSVPPITLTNFVDIKGSVPILGVQFPTNDQLEDIGKRYSFKIGARPQPIEHVPQLKGWVTLAYWPAHNSGVKSYPTWITTKFPSPITSEQIAYRELGRLLVESVKRGNEIRSAVPDVF